MVERGGFELPVPLISTAFDLAEKKKRLNTLANPIYVGEIRHKRVSHPGQHEPIIDRSLWFSASRRC